MQAVLGADRCGIDAPFGWPDAFVDFVIAHHNREPRRELELSNRAGRLPLVRRRTDRVVHEVTGIVPLSVSADLIAHVALRCAGLLARLAVEGVDTDRVAGTAAEVYPAAALQQWRLPFRGYKRSNDRETLAQLVASFDEAMPYLDLADFRGACEASDDAFDAVVAAVIARAVAVGHTRLPHEADTEVAGREGGFTCRPSHYRRSRELERRIVMILAMEGTRETEPASVKVKAVWNEGRRSGCG